MKLTEEEAKELLSTVIGIAIANKETIAEWRKRGWIEKNAVDEFIECYYQFKAYYDDYQGNYPAAKLAKAAMKAIEELQEKLKIKEE